MNARLVAMVLIAGLLAGCSGSLGQNALVPNHASGIALLTQAKARARRHVKAVARFVIPRRERFHPGKHQHFVSSATNGAQIVATGAGQTYTTIVDLSAGSSNCVTQGSTRTCQFAAQVPVGADTISVTTYTKAPVGGVIPTSAQILGIGSSTQTVVSGVTPYVVVYLGGVIGSIGPGPAFSSLPADGSQHVAAFVVNPKDFGNQPIVAGTKTPYNNPIQVTLSETPANAGHAVLLLDGAASGSSATMKFSTDTIALQYDGKGSPGYTVSVGFTATGVTTQSVEVSPLFVRANQIVGGVLGLNGAPSSPTVNITEANAAAGSTYTVTPSGGCSGVASSPVVSGSGAAATFTTTGGASASATGCTFAIVDAFSTTYTLPVTNTPITGRATIGGVQISEYASGMSATSVSIAKGPDGNMWFTSPGSVPPTIGVLNPSTQTLVTSYPLPGTQPEQLATGSDGAVWISDQNLEGADRLTASPVVTVPGELAQYPFPGGASPLGVAASSDGTLWFTDCSSTHGLWNVTVGGGATQPAIVLTGSSATDLVMGPDGAVWFTETNYIGRYDPVGHTLTETAMPASTTAAGIAVGPDGNIWVVGYDVSGSSVLSMAPGSPCPCAFTNDVALNATANPVWIEGGVDNAVWISDVGNHSVDRVNTSSLAVTYYTVNPPSHTDNPDEIAVAPDGTLWFTEGNANNIGHIIP